MTLTLCGVQGGPDLACAGGNFAFRMLSLDAPAFGFAADATRGSKGRSGPTNERWSELVRLWNFTCVSSNFQIHSSNSQA